MATKYGLVYAAVIKESGKGRKGQKIRRNAFKEFVKARDGLDTGKKKYNG